jgi:predicted metalloprotease with PDZ domain
LATVFSAASAHADAIRYTLSPVTKGGQLEALAVEIRFTGEVDGETAIDLPDKWGGTDGLWRGISALQVHGAKRVGVTSDPARRIIQHAPGANLRVRYRVQQIWSGEPETTEFRPIVRPRYFHVIGWTVLARPHWAISTPTSVSFRAFPKRWRVASDLAHGEALTLQETLRSITVGGDFRVLKAGALTVAMRGTWSFSDEAFLKQLEPIVESHSRFWGDPPAAYLVTVIPLKPKPNSMTAGGTGLGDAFAFYATENVDERRLLNGLAHEHMHSWIPSRLGKTPVENDGIVESWFSEGFTDFYASRLLVRDGLATIEEVAERLNEFMWDYAFSSARNMTNSRIAAEFWRDNAAHRMPYQRGLLVAALTDARLRQNSGGARDLDDVMLAMKKAADIAGKDARPPIRDHFVAAMKLSEVDVTEDIRRFIEEGETIALPPDIWSPCGVVTTAEVAEFDLGFKGRRTLENGGVVVGVDPDGPAHAAGLRDGMRILDFKAGVSRDSRVPLTYRVVVDGVVREIIYRPEGKRRVALQELKLRALDDAGRKACAASLGGM